MSMTVASQEMPQEADLAHDTVDMYHQIEAHTEPSERASDLSGTHEDGTDGLSSLPPGWRSQQAPNGQTYYYHEGTRQTQWTPPIGAGQDDNSRSGVSNLSA